MFAKLAQETARADAEAAAKRDAIASRESWKAIADKEGLRADEATKAGKERAEEAANARAAAGFLRTSVDEFKIQRQADLREIDGLRSSRPWYAAGGAAAAGLLCYATRR